MIVVNFRDLLCVYCFFNRFPFNNPFFRHSWSSEAKIILIKTGELGLEPKVSCSPVQGWGTWNRTKINGSKGHCPTVRRSPNSVRDRRRQSCCQLHHSPMISVISDFYFNTQSVETKVRESPIFLQQLFTTIE